MFVNFYVIKGLFLICIFWGLGDDLVFDIFILISFFICVCFLVVILF